MQTLTLSTFESACYAIRVSIDSISAQQPNFILRISQDRFNVDWIAPSQVVHGSVMDIIAAWKLDQAPDGTMTATGELDSLLPMTNAQLLDSCQFAIHTALLIEEEFALAEPPEDPRCSQN